MPSTGLLLLDLWTGIGGVVYGSSIRALAEAGIAQIMIDASAVRDAAPFYRGQILGGSCEPRPTRCSVIGGGSEACQSTACPGSRRATSI